MAYIVMAVAVCWLGYVLRRAVGLGPKVCMGIVQGTMPAHDSLLLSATIKELNPPASVGRCED